MLFRVRNRSERFLTCEGYLCPIFGYLNNIFLTILDNIDITGVRHYLKKLQIQLKNDKMSLVFKKVIGKIQKGENNSLGHRCRNLAKEFNEL